MAEEVVKKQVEAVFNSLVWRDTPAAAKALFDLSYYMKAEGRDEEYLKIFSRTLGEVKKLLPDREFTSFVRALNKLIYRGFEGGERNIMGELFEKMITEKEKRFPIAVEFRAVARRILEVLK